MPISYRKKKKKQSLRVQAYEMYVFECFKRSWKVDETFVLL